jgi:hypothetical protein
MLRLRVPICRGRARPVSRLRREGEDWSRPGHRVCGGVGTITLRRLSRLLNTSEITLLAVVVGLPVTIGCTVGAALGSWRGVCLGLGSALVSFGLIALALRSRAWHGRFIRLANYLRPPDA